MYRDSDDVDGLEGEATELTYEVIDCEDVDAMGGGAGVKDGCGGWRRVRVGVRGAGDGRGDGGIDDIEDTEDGGGDDALEPWDAPERETRPDASDTPVEH